MSKPELMKGKACPHCGWAFGLVNSGVAAKKKCWFFQCAGCGATGPRSFVDAADAARAWEERREIPPANEAGKVLFLPTKYRPLENGDA